MPFDIVHLEPEQLAWLLDGYDVWRMNRKSPPSEDGSAGAFDYPKRACDARTSRCDHGSQIRRRTSAVPDGGDL